MPMSDFQTAIIKSPPPMHTNKFTVEMKSRIFLVVNVVQDL
jgi:hypothetical protein